jgi:hypothetical protein
MPTPPPLPPMSLAERRGRMLLAGAFGLLFVVVFASLLAGQVLWPGVALAVGLALAGGTLFYRGKRGG